jgi:hypothetical protein
MTMACRQRRVAWALPAGNCACSVPTYVVEDGDFPVNMKVEQRLESVNSVIGLAATQHVSGQEVAGQSWAHRQPLSKPHKRVCVHRPDTSGLGACKASWYAGWHKQFPVSCCGQRLIPAPTSVSFSQTHSYSDWLLWLRGNKWRKSQTEDLDKDIWGAMFMSWPQLN